MSTSYPLGGEGFADVFRSSPFAQYGFMHYLATREGNRPGLSAEADDVMDVNDRTRTRRRGMRRPDGRQRHHRGAGHLAMSPNDGDATSDSTSSGSAADPREGRSGGRGGGRGEGREGRGRHDHEGRSDGRSDGRRGGRRGRRGPGGPDGFGGPSFGGFGGPGFGGFGGPGFGPAFGGPGFGAKAARGDIRAGVLALLAEQPRHGYEIIQELAERSGGVWRPSPGSIYPTLKRLADEGLVAADRETGRKVFTLTEAGQAYVAEHEDELQAPWDDVASGVDDRSVQLRDLMLGVAAAVVQVDQAATPMQVQAAAALLAETRRGLYRILAEDPEAAAPGAPDSPEAQ